jgi:MFS family permease
MSMARPPVPSSTPNLGGWQSAFASLRRGQFRWVFASNMAFFLAMQGQGLVRAVIVYDVTDSELALGMVSASVAIAMLLAAPIGGVMADRIERRRLIITAQCAAIASEAMFFGLLITDRLEFWHMIALAAVMGCAFPLIMPARQAIVVNIVGKRGLGSAMALNMAGVNVMRVLGPAAAGFLIAAIGVEKVYAINLGLYIVAVITMLGVSPVPPAARARQLSVLASLAEGVRYVRSHNIVGVLLLYGLVPMFLAMPFQTLLVVFARDVWETGATGLGILNAAAGVGGIAGSFYVAWRGGLESRLRLMMFSVVAFGILLAFFSLSPYFYPAVALILSANVFASIFQTLNNTAIQLLISDDVRGRISSFLMMSFSLPLLGTLPLSAVAERFGAPVAVSGAAAMAVVAAIVFYLVSPALRDMDARVRAATIQD